MPEITIVDTSSLFYFHRVGLFELFKKLYGHIIVPEAAKNELMEGQTQGEDVPQLEKYPLNAYFIATKETYCTAKT